MNGRYYAKPKPSSNTFSQSGVMSNFNNQSGHRVGIEFSESIHSEVLRPRSVNTIHRNLTSKHERKKLIMFNND